MKRQSIFSLVVLAILVTAAAGLVWRYTLDSQISSFALTAKPVDDSARTLKQISDSLVLAKKDNKRVLLQFTSRGCSWCHLLHNVFENDKQIAEELERDYLVVLVDVSDENNHGVDEKYGNPTRAGLPVTVLLDSDGKKLLTKNIAFADQEALRHGSSRIEPDKVLAFLKQWSANKG